MSALLHPALPFGVHRIDAARYHADQILPVPTLSNGIAKCLLNRSPLHAWWQHPRLNPDHEPQVREVWDFGRVAHRIILGAGDDFEVYPVDLLDKRGAVSTADAKAWEAEKRAAGITPIKAEVAQRAEAMARVMADALRDVGLRLDPERSELAAVAEVDGVACRCLVDNAPAQPLRGHGLVLVDFKTCEDASPDACIAAVERYSYDLQWAHYQDVWEAATGERRAWLFVFQEKQPPFEVSFLRLHDDPSDEADWGRTARDKAAYARDLWARCLADDHWPGFPRRVGIVGARPHYAARWAEAGTREWAAPPKASPDTLRAAYAAQAPERTA